MLVMHENLVGASKFARLIKNRCFAQIDYSCLNEVSCSERLEGKVKGGKNICAKG